jgi:hypothetical protein
LNVVTINLNPDEDKDLLTDEEKKDLKQTIEKLKTNSFEGRNSIQTNAWSKEWKQLSSNAFHIQWKQFWIGIRITRI